MVSLGVTLAFPADWRGRAARTVGVGGGLIFVLWVLAGSLPSGFAADMGARSEDAARMFFEDRGMKWLVDRAFVVGLITRGCIRGLGLLGGWIVARWIGRFVAIWLPTTPVLAGRTLWIRALGRRHRIPVQQIRSVYVEHLVDGPGDTLSVELRDGQKLPFCPLTWDGAGRLYGALVRARRGRRARRS